MQRISLRLNRRKLGLGCAKLAWRVRRIAKPEQRACASHQRQ
jgi:hypothetical protein